MARRLPVELLPQLAQDVVTDAEGRFTFGVDGCIGKPPYVTVTRPDGQLTVTRTLDAGADDLVFELLAPDA